MKTRPRTLLVELAVGQQGTVCQITDQSPAALRYLSDIGLVPSAAVRLIQRAPLGDSLTLTVDGGAKRTISSEVAEKIRIAV